MLRHAFGLSLAGSLFSLEMLFLVVNTNLVAQTLTEVDTELNALPDAVKASLELNSFVTAPPSLARIVLPASPFSMEKLMEYGACAYS